MRARLRRLGASYSNEASTMSLLSRAFFLLLAAALLIGGPRSYAQAPEKPTADGATATPEGDPPPADDAGAATLPVDGATPAEALPDDAEALPDDAEAPPDGAALDPATLVEVEDPDTKPIEDDTMLPGQPIRAESWSPDDPTAPYDPDGPIADPTPRNRRVLSLEQARQVLIENSFELQLNEQNLKRAAILESQAFSIWIPTVNVTARYTARNEEVPLSFPNSLAPLTPYLESVYARDPILQQFFNDNPAVPDARLLAQQPGVDAVIQARHNYQLIGTVSQTLFNARAFPLMRLADLMKLRSQHAAVEIEYQLQGALSQTYFSAVMFRRFIEVSRRNVELSRLGYERARVAQEEQVGNQFEVNRARVSLAKAERELANARLSYELSLQSLATFVNIEPDFDVESPSRLSAPPEAKPLVDQALEERPDFKGIDIDVAVAREQVVENESTYWPVLTAQFQGMFQRATALSGSPFSWTFTVQASWTLYDGGFRAAETETRELEVARLEILREQKRTQVSGEVRQAWIRARTQQAVVESARAEVALAKENYELTRDARDLGVATALEVEVAQEQRFLSELALANAESTLQSQLYSLYWLSMQSEE